MAERPGERRTDADDRRRTDPMESGPGSDPGEAYRRARKAGEVEDDRRRSGDDANRGPGVDDVFRSGS